MVHRKIGFFHRSLTVASIALLAACSGEHPQTTFEPVTEYGRILNRLFANTFWWTIGILILVEVLIVYFSFRYRAQPGQPRPKQIHGNVKLEFLWTIIPAVIVLFIAIPTIEGVFATQRKAPDDALVVEVIGHQWWWEFYYPEYDVRTANELVMPTGRTISLKMHSADVVHSFWIPRLGGKRDVNPQPKPREGERARSNYITFIPEQPGYYLGQCAEFCGASHAIMRTAGVVMAPAEFEAWTVAMGGTRRAGAPGTAEPTQGAATADREPQTAGATASPVGGAAGAPRDTLTTADTTRPPQAGAAAPPQQGTPSLQGPATPAGPVGEAERGRQLFTSKICIACHTVQGTPAQGRLGPSLTRFGTRKYVGAGAALNTPENLIAWIKSPKSMKPGALMPGVSEDGGGMPATALSDEEVRAIAAFLLSLK